MAKTSERVSQLTKQFMDFHKQGWSIKEIADHFHLTTRCIYYNLQAIADYHEVSRDSLLSTPHKQHKARAKSLRLYEEINLQELTKNFEEMIENANSIISKIDTILSEDEKQEED